MLQSQQPTEPDRRNQQLWMVQYPAMTVMVFLRQRIGYRLINPFSLAATTALLALVGSAANPDTRPQDLILFVLTATSLGFGLKIRRWLEFRRGIKQHSYYIGTSIFDSPRLPSFLRRHRRVARFIDPAVCILAGVLLIPYSTLLGIWLFISGASLKVFEDLVHRKELNEQMDLIDGMVSAERYGDTMDRFSDVPKAASPRPGKARGIPTGLGPDIRRYTEGDRNDAKHITQKDNK